MLIRTDILMNRIRQEADMVDDTALSDIVLMNYLNDAQKTIQNIIFQADQSNNVIVGRSIITAVPNQIEYDLPDTVYCESSIIDVHSITSDNRPTRRYEKNAFSERSAPFGYSIENRKIILNHSPTDDILIRFNERYPLIGPRIGQISNIASAAKG